MFELTSPYALRRILFVLTASLFAAAWTIAEERGTGTSTTPAAGAEREAVLAVVAQVFDGMRKRDEELLRTAFTANARLGEQAIDSFISAVVAGSRHLDEVTFDETVLIDGDLAMAWTPYNIFVDGDFHHCGVDLFVMRRGDGVWRITHLDDTRRVDDCHPERRR